MPRGETSVGQKQRNSQHAAQTGLKVGNLRVKGENFYRDAKKAKRVNLLSGKSVKAVRDKDGKILKEAEFQSKDAKPGRVQPDRRWFGNTRTISQKALDHFRTSMENKANDPYSVVLKRNKLPMSLLTDAAMLKAKPDLTTTEPFSDTFGAKAQRKRPRLDVGSFSELANKATSSQATVAGAVSDAALESGQQVALDDVTSAVVNQADEPNNRPQDYILSAGTSRRIWGELYKVIDSSDVILHVLDARDPLGTRCDSVETYLAKEKRGKKLVYVLNKVDLVPGWVAARWVKILSQNHPTIAFHASINNSFGKGSLIQLLRQFSTLYSDKKQISVGFIGYPNVGKSSIINTLKKKLVCKAAPIPGETKVWQYITLMRRIYLIDCPGIVPPSARDTDAQKVLKGIVRVEHLSNPAEHVPMLISRVRREYLERTYGVKGWTDADDFLGMLAQKTGKLHKGGEADLRTVATVVLNDWIRGKIPYFVAPPEDVARGGKPTAAGKKGKAAASAATGKRTRDELGNEVGEIRGVTQPLHQIVRSTKFLEDDEGEVEMLDAEGDGDEAEEVEEDEWNGIDEASGDEVSVDVDEEDHTSGSAAEDVPLEWDDLFDQVVAREAGMIDDDTSADEEFDDDFSDKEDEEVEIVMDDSSTSLARSISSLAAEKRQRPAAVSDSDDERRKSTKKEPRMTTNKRKASNYYTTANVKNKNRSRKLPENPTARKKSKR